MVEVGRRIAAVGLELKTAGWAPELSAAKLGGHIAAVGLDLKYAGHAPELPAVELEKRMDPSKAAGSATDLKLILVPPNLPVEHTLVQPVVQSPMTPALCQDRNPARAGPGARS